MYIYKIIIFPVPTIMTISIKHHTSILLLCCPLCHPVVTFKRSLLCFYVITYLYIFCNNFPFTYILSTSREMTHTCVCLLFDAVVVSHTSVWYKIDCRRLRMIREERREERLARFHGNPAKASASYACAEK